MKKLKDSEFPYAVNPVFENGEMLPSNPVLGKTVDYLGKVVHLSKEDAEKLKEELRKEIDWKKYMINEDDVEAILCKIVDLLPMTAAEVLAILDWKVNLKITAFSEEDIKKIIEIVAKYARTSVHFLTFI